MPGENPSILSSRLHGTDQGSRWSLALMLFGPFVELQLCFVSAVL